MEDLANETSEKIISEEKIKELQHAFIKAHTPWRRTEAKIGRNEPCPCGSGKKYKNCCIKKSEYTIEYARKS